MGKSKANGSSQNMGKPKRRLQDYFDPSHNGIVTPNQRSLPKYRGIFERPRGKSLKKEQAKRLSNAKALAKKEKENFSPGKTGKSGQKISRYEQSIGR